MSATDPFIDAPRPTTNIGEETYRIVNEWPGNHTLTARFQALAGAWGMKPGTVAANYYRIARAKGEGRPRKAAAPKAMGEHPAVAAVRALVIENVVLRERLAAIEKAVGK